MDSPKKMLSLILIVMVFGGLGIAVAADPLTADGNDRKGWYLFKKDCRSCHDGSTAPELSPNSKTQAQWQRAFESYERLDCVQEEWEKLSEKDTKDIYTYLYNHAYDSPQPATCK